MPPLREGNQAREGRDVNGDNGHRDHVNGGNVIMGRWGPSGPWDDEEPPAHSRPGAPPAPEHWMPDPGEGWGGHGDDRDLGDLTRIIVIRDQVVDVARRPIVGSGYESDAIRLGAGRPLAPPPPPPVPTPPPHERQLVWLEHLVGGADALTALDAEPLSPDAGDDHADLGHVAWDAATRLVRILSRIDDVAPGLIGPEGAIAARRLAIRAVTNQPRLLGALERDTSTPAAVIHATGRGNDLVGPSKRVLAKEIAAAFDLSVAPTQRSRAFAGAASGLTLSWPPGLIYQATPDVMVLGAPDLLVSGFRRQLVQARDEALRLRAVTPTAS
jgi:hypothetical protein